LACANGILFCIAAEPLKLVTPVINTGIVAQQRIKGVWRRKITLPDSLDDSVAESAGMVDTLVS
jgi:hypothetical protein